MRRYAASSVAMCSAFFFFFQAEDGIRDKLVTGVQTCALPISIRRHRAPPPKRFAQLAQTRVAARQSRRLARRAVSFSSPFQGISRQSPKDHLDRKSVV